MAVDTYSNERTTGRRHGAPLECVDAGVNYGEFVALSNVTATFDAGLIHAVVGQNGAGKTTFARLVAGLVRSSNGCVRVDGRQLRGGSVDAARQAGVELVHQSFALPPSFTVVQAMEFGARRGGLAFSKRGLANRWRAHLEQMGLARWAESRIGDLPIDVQQSVEIARALTSDAKVLVLDEPTAAITPGGAERLFERLRTLKSRGVTILLILHKIREVLAIADTVTVLRGGRLVLGPMPSSGISAEELSEAIVGASPAGVSDASPEGINTIPQERKSRPTTILALDSVSTRPDGDDSRLSNVTMRIAPGEIVGVAGVEGNGQRQLVGVIAGLSHASQGSISIGSSLVTSAPLKQRRRLGLRIVPFERNTEGLSLTTSLWENWSVLLLIGARSWRWITPSRFRLACKDSLTRWSVKHVSVRQPAGSLSGGNAQKVILARELDASARVVVVAQPTRGLDVGATRFTWSALRDARDRGAGILLVSSDLDELLELSDRLFVMSSGQVAAEFQPPYHLREIGKAMTVAK
jgi:simple sugar transport system ATP-binding protein